MASNQWNPFAAEQVTLTTPLSPDECVQRIQASIRSFWRDGDPAAPFWGSVQDYTFAVFKDRIFNRSATRIVAEGEIHANGDEGAIITIRLPLHVTGGPIFLAGYGIALVWIVSQILAMFSLRRELTILMTIFITVIIGAAGVYCYGLIASLFLDDQREFLTSTLRNRLDASVVTPKPERGAAGNHNSGLPGARR